MSELSTIEGDIRTTVPVIEADVQADVAKVEAEAAPVVAKVEAEAKAVETAVQAEVVTVEDHNGDLFAKIHHDYDVVILEIGGVTHRLKAAVVADFEEALAWVRGKM